MPQIEIVCSVQDCERPRRYLRDGGLCTKHWARTRRGMPVDYQPPTECLTCGAPIQQHPNRKGRFRRYCKGCEPAHKIENRKRYYEENRERERQRSREYQVQAKYGLTMSEWEAIVARGCAICGTHEGQICVDHDHSNGHIRDALCGHCNRALGCVNDDPARLRRLAEYLERHR